MSSTAPTSLSRRQSAQTEGHAEIHPTSASQNQAATVADASPRIILNQTRSPSLSSVPTIKMASPPPPIEDEPTRCWICLQDETEDTVESGDWRSPCPCNLRAHETCLLDWITDLQTDDAGAVIRCPQCKGLIKLTRENNLVVLATDAVLRLGRILVVPTAVSAVMGCVYAGCLTYGINTVHLVFGPEEAQTMLTPTLMEMHRRAGFNTTSWGRFVHRALKTMDPFFLFDSGLPWKAVLGLPLVAPMLILSRTSLIDNLLPVIPTAYLAFRPGTQALKAWPPSPGLTLAVLPYIRLCYNEMYKSNFAELEKEWDQAVQRKPREGETAEQVAEAAQARAAEDALIELEVDLIDIIEPDRPRGGNDNAQGGNNQGERRRVEDNRPGPDGQVVRETHITTALLASKFVGALFFPAISSYMGDILKYSLPARWVTKSSWGRGTGILQERWGRSIIGGCLFVVLKDALILYCKWKKARDYGRRKVLDFPKPRRR